MKLENTFVKLLSFILLLSLALLGIRLAPMINEHEVYTEGILGLFFMYLFLRVFWSSAAGSGGDNVLTYAKAVKLLVFVFTYSIVCFLFIVRIADMIMLIWRTLVK